MNAEPTPLTPPVFSGTAPTPPAPPSPATDQTPLPLVHDQSEFNVLFVHSRLDDYGLSAPQFRVYCHLARRASKGTAWPSVASIAKTCRLNQATARAALGFLAAHRLIARQPRPGETTFYRITGPSQWQPADAVDGHPCETDTPPLVSEAPLPKTGQDYPSQNRVGEGNPVEGDPRRQTHTARGRPTSEAQAVEWASMDAVPGDFARAEFLRLSAVDWIDGVGRAVRHWRPYLRKRWMDEQSQRAERAANPRARGARPQPARQFHREDYKQSLTSF